MKSVWAFAGRALYYTVGYVIIPVFVKGTVRTRVAVFNEDKSKILLARSFISNQKWELLGGGVKKGESAVDGAAREAAEEAGVNLTDSDLTFIKESRELDRHADFTARYYWASVSSEDYKKQTFEILDLKWFKTSQLPKNINQHTLAFVSELLHKV